MAAEFIGFTILVTLRSPPNAQIQGIVADVVNQKLYLQNVLLLWSSRTIPTYVLDAADIVDVEVAREQLPSQASPPPPPPPLRQSTSELLTPTATSHGQNIPPPPSQPQAAGFADPAILSYSKPPSTNLPRQLLTTPSQSLAQPISPIMIADGTIPSPLTQVDVGRRTAVKQSSVSSIATTTQGMKAKTKNAERERRDSHATAVLTEPFDALALEDQVAQPIEGKKGKREKTKHKSANSLTGPGIIDMKDINGPLSKTTKKQAQPKGKGWRQTPLIEEIPVPNLQVPRDRKRGRRREYGADVNGWATEDATDIQDLGDFDFESNLSKFDKRRVFDDLRKDDTTADEERLVSFNRLPKAKAGTNGGRNLHWTENVLEPTPITGVPPVSSLAGTAEAWNSEAGETENEVRATNPAEEPYSSGRGSRRAGSRRPLQARKGSTLLGAQLERTASPRPYAAVAAAGKVGMATSPMNGSESVSGRSGIRASFRLRNGKPCHCVSPLQMLEVEQLCISEMGLTEDMLTENAGRSIAEAVLKSSASSTSAPATEAKIKEVHNILFLVGNHKSGARAIAAARHLRNRRLRVTVIVLGGDRGETFLLESVRRQLAIYRKGGGWVERWDEYQAKIHGGGVNGAAHEQVPDVVVDAILGVHVAFDELRTDDQAVAFEMVRWASRISSPLTTTATTTTTVLSIDVPSGLSATSGLITEAEGQLLVMNSRTVVAMGAPKIGLLHALAMDGVGIAGGDEAAYLDGSEVAGWNVLVADIGISTAVWQRHGSRRRQGVDFGAEWLVSVGFVGGG